MKTAGVSTLKEAWCLISDCLFEACGWVGSDPSLLSCIIAVPTDMRVGVERCQRRRWIRRIEQQVWYCDLGLATRSWMVISSKCHVRAGNGRILSKGRRCVSANTRREINNVSAVNRLCCPGFSRRSSEEHGWMGEFIYH